jgi:hypothetical protein
MQQCKQKFKSNKDSRKQMPKQSNISKYAIVNNPNDNPSIQLPDHFAFKDASKI